MKSLFLKRHIVAKTLMIIGVLTVLTFSSCDKAEMHNKDENGLSDNYYVKYVIKGNGTYGRFSNWTATTPEGGYSNSGYQTRSWNQTFGPVKKGFTCKVQIKGYIGGAPIIEIHVLKNQEPFALKRIQTGRSASYSIDF